MNHVFLSYKSENEALAKHLKEVLEQNGISTWMSCTAIAPGNDFSEEIMQAIESCSAFVLLLTPEAQGSTWIANEVKTAIDCKKPLFPVQPRPVPLTPSFRYLLSSSQVITLSNIHGEDPATRKLIAALKACASGKPKTKLYSSPTAAGDHRKWIGAAIAAVAVALVLLIGFNLIKGLASGPSLELPDLGDFLSQQQTSGSTMPTADPSAVNQILSCHENEVLTLKYADSLTVLNRTIRVKAGEYASLSIAWDNYYIYSEDSGIAVGEGPLIKGVSPGTTYIVVAVNETTADAYYVIVE